MINDGLQKNKDANFAIKFQHHKSGWHWRKSPHMSSHRCCLFAIIFGNPIGQTISFLPPHLHIPHNWHICQQYFGHIPWALWEIMRSFIFFPSPHIPNTQTAVQPPQEILNEGSVTQPPKSHPWSRRQSRRWPKLPGLPPWSPCPSSRKSHHKQLQPWSTAAWPWPCWWYAPGHCAPKSWVIRGFFDPRAMKHRTHTHTH